MRKELFNELMASAQEAVEHSRGKRDLRVTKRARPPKQVTPKQIVGIRRQLNYSQAVFASTLNVSLKTVQAWEQGTRKPSGPTLKLLEIVKVHPDVFDNQ